MINKQRLRDCHEAILIDKLPTSGSATMDQQTSQSSSGHFNFGQYGTFVCADSLTDNECESSGESDSETEDYGCGEDEPSIGLYHLTPQTTHHDYNFTPSDKARGQTTYHGPCVITKKGNKFAADTSDDKLNNLNKSSCSHGGGGPQYSESSNTTPPTSPDHIAERPNKSVQAESGEPHQGEPEPHQDEPHTGSKLTSLGSQIKPLSSALKTLFSCPVSEWNESHAKSFYTLFKAEAYIVKPDYILSVSKTESSQFKANKLSTIWKEVVEDGRRYNVSNTAPW